jgi:hypothetical protein
MPTAQRLIIAGLLLVLIGIRLAHTLLTERADHMRTGEYWFCIFAVVFAVLVGAAILVSTQWAIGAREG